MFDQEKIDAVKKRGVEEGWPFPYLFNSLKALGIDRYEVDVLTHETRFVGGGATIVEPAPAGFSILTAGKTYELTGLKTALARVQAKESNYEEFLTEIAAAGVVFYRVDMRPRTVTYHGADKRHKHVETVPETNQP